MLVLYNRMEPDDRFCSTGIFLSDSSPEVLLTAGLGTAKLHVMISTVPFAAGYTAPESLLREHKPGDEIEHCTNSLVYVFHTS